MSEIEQAAMTYALMLSVGTLRKAEEFQRMCQSRRVSQILRDTAMVNILCLQIAAEQGNDYFPADKIASRFSQKTYYDSLVKLRRILGLAPPVVTFDSLAVRLGAQGLLPVAVALKRNFLLRYERAHTPTVVDENSEETVLGAEHSGTLAVKNLLENNESEVNAASFLLAYVASRNLKRRLPSHVKIQVMAMGVSNTALERIMNDARELCKDDLASITAMSAPKQEDPASGTSSTAGTTAPKTRGRKRGPNSKLNAKSSQSSSSSSRTTTTTVVSSRGKGRARKTNAASGSADSEEVGGETKTSMDIPDITTVLDQVASEVGEASSNQSELNGLNTSTGPHGASTTSEGIALLRDQIREDKSKLVKNLKSSGINSMLPLKGTRYTRKYRDYVAWKNKIVRDLPDSVLKRFGTRDTLLELD